MLHIFRYDNEQDRVMIDEPEILLVKEFSDLLDEKRNKCKEDPTGKKHLRAYRDLTYIWLATDWGSFYANDPERIRHEQALSDAGITEEEYQKDEVLRAAKAKYIELQNSNLAIRSLSAAKTSVNKFIDYFNSLDPTERDIETNKPIFKVKDLMAEVNQLSGLIDQLQILEQKAKKEMVESSRMRGGVEEEILPDFL